MLLSTQTTIQKIWLPEDEYPKIEVSNNFPPYTPEENPQEYVWKEGRSKITHNKFIPNLKQTALKFITYLNQIKFKYSLLGFKSNGGM